MTQVFPTQPYVAPGVVPVGNPVGAGAVGVSGAAAFRGGAGGFDGSRGGAAAFRGGGFRGGVRQSTNPKVADQLGCGEMQKWISPRTESRTAPELHTQLLQTQRSR
jgi:hypothetical protein